MFVLEFDAVLLTFHAKAPADDALFQFPPL